MHLPRNSDGQASLRRHEHGDWHDAPELQKHEVNLETLDEVSKDLQRLDFIKCDVEGAEMLVLRGATRTLEKFSPILHLEVFEEWTRAFGYTPNDLMDLLQSSGYSDIRLEVKSNLIPIQSASQLVGSQNIVCAKTGVLQPAPSF